MLASILPAITGIMSLLATQHARDEQRRLAGDARLHADRLAHDTQPRELMEYRADCQANPDKANPREFATKDSHLP
jgi:hypothetical protein